MDDRDLMDIRVATLYALNARGRLLCTNEPEGRPAPRLFLGRTPGGDVIRFGEAVPDATAQRLTDIVASWPPAGDVTIPPEHLSALRDELTRHAAVAKEGGGPAYRFPESVARPNGVVEVTDDNVDVARDTYPWLRAELAALRPCFAVLRDDAAVSLCFSSRNGEAAAEAGVETLPDFRGRGCAAAATAAWAASIRAGGRIPLYSTAWGNVASQGVARRLGLLLFGVDATLA